MRYNLERVTRIVVFLAVSVTGLAAFQNCSGYKAVDNPLYDQTIASTCIGLACAQDPTLLQLSVGNDSPLLLKGMVPSGTCGNDNGSCLDLAGFCDDGGYSQTQMVWSITGGSYSDSATLANNCVDGRWALQVKLGSNFDYMNSHQITIKLKGVDPASGAAIDSTTGGNTRQLTINPY